MPCIVKIISMRTLKIAFLCAILVTICSCSAVKRTVYLQDIEDNTEVKTALEQQITIKPFDRLIVVVTSKDSELSAPFNVMTSYSSLSSNPMGQASVSSAQSLQIRTVDENGDLLMPIIGKVACAGKSRSQVADAIAKSIIDGGYITDAAVNIQFADMKLYVLGEVAKPGQFDITRDQVTILEALAMAGDMTIYGNRTNVSVVRKENGVTTTHIVNLLDSGCFSSPAYYLQQGDVIYVQPKRQRAATGEINQNRNFWISIASTLISAATLIVTITKLSGN